MEKQSVKILLFLGLFLPSYVYNYGGDFMQCLRCGNTEERYFYKDMKGWYCRKCIMFGRIAVGELPKQKPIDRKVIHADYQRTIR